MCLLFKCSLRVPRFALHSRQIAGHTNQARGRDKSLFCSVLVVQQTVVNKRMSNDLSVHESDVRVSWISFNAINRGLNGQSFNLSQDAITIWP